MNQIILEFLHINESILYTHNLMKQFSAMEIQILQIRNVAELKMGFTVPLVRRDWPEKGHGTTFYYCHLIGKSANTSTLI